MYRMMMADSYAENTMKNWLEKIEVNGKLSRYARLNSCSSWLAGATDGQPDGQPLRCIWVYLESVLAGVKPLNDWGVSLSHWPLTPETGVRVPLGL